MLYEILWRSHAILISTSFLAVVSGIVISLVFKKKKWRFRIHRTLGIYAGLSGLIALLTAVIMVQIFSGYHFSSIHAVVGGATGLLLVFTPIAGLKTKTEGNKKRMKLFHRISGFLAAAMMLYTILLGLSFTGLLAF